MVTSTYTSFDVDSLDRAIAGRAVAPDAPDWDAVRLGWNLAVDHRPAAIALPESAADVATVVDFARTNGLRVAPQGTGHNAHNLEGRLDDTVLVKTSRMRDVQIDPSRRRARAEAGTIWTDVTVPAAEHGLAALAGSSPDVGIVGYTLGGGLSWLSRRYGLAANRVLAIELVTADGELVRTDREREPDLFWALRGGGGSFGVVTAIEFELLPVTEVYAGAAFWPRERAAEVLAAWRDWTRQELPDEIISVGRLVNVPPLPDIPEPLRGQSFAVVEAIYQGDEAEGARLIAPLRELGPQIDTFATIPAVALSHLHMDPEHPVPGKGDGMLLDDAPDAVLDAMIAATAPEKGSALVSSELRQLGGAIARNEPGQGAVGAIDAAYAMYTVGMTPTPELAPVVEEQVSAVKDALAPWDADRMYLNFSERPIDARRLYAGDYTYRRLQAVKAAFDPTDLFQSTHPIR
jgi:UDP-N-acetylenolpyruvoylglucosamine reductase